MSEKWENFLDNLHDETATLLKEEFRSLILFAKEDQQVFIRRQGEKLELYLNQLAEGAITKEQFEGYVIDIRDLTRMQSRKMTVAGKASAQRIIKGLTKLALKGLMAIV
ncbi:MAG: hypothetical protein ACT4OO_04450 [Nitrospiraceae bacterium]